ncbi:MAG: hypothetical protein KAG53_11410 [Endozoicomonadaceae bacterium]|nr:hypothetical protein [Endozoicomonadaceae bacterium]
MSVSFIYEFRSWSGSGNLGSTLGRFRTRLVEHHLWDKLLAEINRQLEAKNIMSEGRINIIDATQIAALSFW